MSDYTDRQAAALTKLEAATTIVDAFANGAAGATVQTDSGMVPSVSKLAADLGASYMQAGAIYADTATGLSATSDGKFFSVPGADADDYTILYKNAAGVAVEVKRYPSTSTIDAINSQAVPKTELGLALFDAVTADTTVVSLNVAAPAAFPRALPFMGWGEIYTPAGVTFNAIRIKTIARTPGSLSARWHTLNIVIRTGANPDHAASTVVAVGTTVVNDASDALSNVPILLRDPATNALKTLTDADFDGGAYLIGVYALGESGMPASCGEPLGTMSNTQSIGVYADISNTGSALNGAWQIQVGGGNRKGFQHLLLTNPVQLSSFGATDALATDLSSRGGQAYALAIIDQVSATSATTELDVTAIGDSPRALPFSGWGGLYTPVGVSFNAVQIPSISRVPPTLPAQQWSTLNIVVRTGATPAAKGATVVAVGSLRVDPSADALSNVTILLRDPATNAVKTLTDADFGGGSYMIGVYASNALGEAAACGTPCGTLPNSQGARLYFSTLDPIRNAWTRAADGIEVGFRHLLLADPSQTTVYSPAKRFVDELIAKSTLTPPDPPVAPPPMLVLPPVWYAVAGRESNLYWDNLVPGKATRYSFDANTTLQDGGVQQNERVTWTPSAPGNGTLTVSMYDGETGEKLNSGSINQIAVAAAANAGATKHVLVIGDSLIAAGVITQTLLDIASTDAMGITLLGSRGVSPNVHEGRGGWTIDFYTSNNGPVDYQFQVSGVVVPPAINAIAYTNNGSTYFVQETNLVDGAGTITCSLLSGGAPSANGTLVKSGAAPGDPTIAFSSSAALPGNPFWIAGAVNFPQYLANKSIVVPDWVVIGLGINDAFNAPDDDTAISLAVAAFQKLDVLLDSIKSAGASVKIALMVPSPPSSQDAFGLNYSLNQNYARDKRNIVLWAQQLILRYGNQVANRIYIVPSGESLDTVNNMQVGASAPANSRSTVSIVRQSNGVHPASSGYQQIGDAVWAFLKCN